MVNDPRGIAKHYKLFWNWQKWYYVKAIIHVLYYLIKKINTYPNKQRPNVILFAKEIINYYININKE